MAQKKTSVSIIIVHYKAKRELFACLESIKESGIKVSYEVIIVDNDETKTIGKELKKKFPWVMYIENKKNAGFGAGNNLGASFAKGEFLFFLNPDTIIKRNSVDRLVEFIERDKKVGIVAPLLLDKQNKPYPLQGTRDLTPVNAIFALSFLNKWFPHNPISKKYWLLEWNKKNDQEVDVVPGSAFVIRQDVFRKIGCFDESFFLYFEESDLCKRVRDLGYRIVILPKSKVVHLWGRSTQCRDDAKAIFAKSRFIYFQKHYGFLWATWIEFVMSINRFSLILGAILVVSLFLRIYRLDTLMMFIDDFSWFYLSARDMLLTGSIPLVGIASSQIWLHQGPLWTYILSGALLLFNFSPLSGGYLAVGLGVASVFLIYWVGKEMFGQRVGVISSLLYATSPIVIIHTRMPYHTSPIPPFMLLFMYSLYQWVQGRVIYFPLTLFFIGVLYNFELATTVLWFIVVILFLYGILEKKPWVQYIFTKKIAILSTLTFVIPMTPILIYDINRGFVQTAKFAHWVIYHRIIKFFLQFNIQNASFIIPTMVPFLAEYYTRLIFMGSKTIAFLIFICSFGWFSYRLVTMSRRKPQVNYIVLSLCIFIPLAGFLFNQTPSEAYIPLFFPTIIFVAALFIDKLMNLRLLFIPSILTLGAICFLNAYILLKENYLMEKPHGYGTPISTLLTVSKEVVRETNGQSYNLTTIPKNVQLETLEYLTWWLGSPPSKYNTSLNITVIQDKKGFHVEKIYDKNIF